MSFLILVRHGQIILNLEKRFTGWVDVDLTENGKLEAEKAGELIKKMNIKIDTYYSSLQLRAKNTLKIIQKILNDENKSFSKNWQLNERHYGALQGLDKIDTAKKYGEKQVHEWRRGYKTKPPLIEKDSKFDPRQDEAYEDIDIALPLGESLEDVVARVESTLNEIIELSENKNVLVVAHGNSIRAMLKTIENISDDSIVEVNIPTGIPLAFNINNDKITKIGYLGDQETIEELEKEIEQQSKIEKDN